jgi:hypothetical protein
MHVVTRYRRITGAVAPETTFRPGDIVADCSFAEVIVRAERRWLFGHCYIDRPVQSYAFRIVNSLGLFEQRRLQAKGGVTLSLLIRA